MIKGQARELKAEKQAAQRDGQAETWQPILDAITAGEASWDDLTQMQKLTMPVGYQIKCRAAARRHSTPLQDETP